MLSRHDLIRWAPKNVIEMEGIVKSIKGCAGANAKKEIMDAARILYDLVEMEQPYDPEVCC
jgi:hypothetical protein